MTRHVVHRWALVGWPKVAPGREEKRSKDYNRGPVETLTEFSQTVQEVVNLCLSCTTLERRGWCWGFT